MDLAHRSRREVLGAGSSALAVLLAGCPGSFIDSNKRTARITYELTANQASLEHVTFEYINHFELTLPPETRIQWEVRAPEDISGLSGTEVTETLGTYSWPAAYGNRKPTATIESRSWSVETKIRRITMETDPRAANPGLQIVFDADGLSDKLPESESPLSVKVRIGDGRYPVVHGRVLKPGANLTGEDFTGIDLGGVALDRATVSGGTFTEVRVDHSTCREANFDRIVGINLSAYGSDLRHSTFTNATLDQSSFPDARLRDVSFDDSAIPGGDFTAADCRGARFRGADLTDSRIVRTDLRHADFSGSDLRDARINCDRCKRCSFRAADLRGADFRGSDLFWADLSEAQFSIDGVRDADLYGVAMNNVDLPGITLRNKNLGAASLNHSSFPSSDFTGSTISHGWMNDANLREATLVEVDLSGQKLKRANLRGANLHGADLGGTRFQGADLRGADLTETRINRTYFVDVDLRGADFTGADYSDRMPYVDGVRTEDCTSCPTVNPIA